MEKRTIRFIKKIERAAKGAQMHLSGAEQDKKEIIEKRKELSFANNPKKIKKIIKKISDAKGKMEESAYLYKINLVHITEAIKKINGQKVLRAIALQTAGKFFGETIPEFPELPV